jgi:hypothetical protein
MKLQIVTVSCDFAATIAKATLDLLNKDFQDIV